MGIKKVKQFVTTDVWRVRSSRLPRFKAFLLKHLRVVLLAMRGFTNDKCMLRASALTFLSLLSIVPVFAMAFGVAKGFGFEKRLEELLVDKLQGQEEVLGRIIDFSRTMLENTKGGIIAGIGVALLFWTVIKVLGNIENSFNDIWGVKVSRSMVRKFSDYIAIMLICPMLLILSSSLTVFISTQVTGIIAKISFLGPVSSLIYFLLNFLPYGVLWGLFSFIYIAMPNTKVNVSAGIFAGVAAGTIYQIIQWVYITFQIGASKYGAIYGSFAALPLFLVWLQVSWLIVLLGAEFSYSYQNVDMYEREPDCVNISYALRKLLLLRIVQVLVKRFADAQKPMTNGEVSAILEIPVRLTNELLFDLVNANIIIEVASAKEKVHAYQPAQDPANFSILYVIDALERSGSEMLEFHRNETFERLQSSMKNVHALFEKSPDNVLLKDI